MKYIFLLMLFGINCYGQGIDELYQQSKTAYAAKDYKKFLVITQKLDSLRPSHPAITYNLAVGYALANDTTSAINTLRKSIWMNNETDFETDADFDNIRQGEGYQKLLKLKSGLGSTLRSSEKIATLSEKDLHPEGLLYLSKTKTWLATSIHKGKIVSFDINTGACKDWLNTGDMLSVFSIKPDKNEKYLWVATAAMPEMAHYDKSTAGRGEVLKVDIDSQKIMKRFPLEGNHVFGDLAVANNGTVYISDSGDAAIYKIEKDQLSIWLSLEKEAFNLQGIIFNDDEDTLFIADYLKGILSIPVVTPDKRKWLFGIGGINKGIDGLLYYRQSLYLIQNGVKPIRIMRLTLDTKNETLAYNILDNNRPEFNEPALGTIVDGNLYFFGNCPWSAYDKNAQLDESKVTAPELYRFSLRN